MYYSITSLKVSIFYHRYNSISKPQKIILSQKSFYFKIEFLWIEFQVREFNKLCFIDIFKKQRSIKKEKQFHSFRELYAQNIDKLCNKVANSLNSIF